ncbi:MAG: hypothetical protein ACRYGG_09440 [Janthinobacterium lividum]
MIRPMVPVPSVASAIAMPLMSAAHAPQNIAPATAPAAGFHSLRAPTFVFAANASWRNNCDRTRITRLIDDLATPALEPADAVALDAIERDAARVLAERFAACGELNFDDAMALYVRLRAREADILKHPALLDGTAADMRAPSLQWLESLLALRKFTASDRLGRVNSTADIQHRRLATLHKLSSLRDFLSTRLDGAHRALNFGEMQRYNETRWLSSWISWERAAELAAHPTHLLHAIFAQGGTHPPELDLQAGDFHELTLPQDFLYSAFSLALNRVKSGSALRDFIDRDLAIHQQGLRHAAHAALRSDTSNQRTIDDVVGTNLPRSSNRTRHDGFCFVHASNQTAQQVIQRWLDRADLAPFAATAMAQQVERHLAECGESTVYPIGTPEQSMHSTLLRVYAANAKPVPNTWRNVYSLAHDFVITVAQWARRDIDYPLSPELLAAVHLQSSCGTTFEQMAAELNGDDAASQT